MSRFVACAAPAPRERPADDVAPAPWAGAGATGGDGARSPAAQEAARWDAQGTAQWNESPQAQDPPALGLSMVKPCFSMVSAKSIVAPAR
jgi:hypothetical protein